MNCYSRPFPLPRSPSLPFPQVIVQKLSSREETREAVLPYADRMMGLFLRVFACRSATVHEEAMLAIGALAYAAGEAVSWFRQVRWCMLLDKPG